MREGKLDREFLYLQNSFDASRLLNFYHSTEIDVNEMHSGKIEKKLHLTNTYLSIGSAPLDWLSLSAGYDATRNVYLFETNSSVADSLLIKHFSKGFVFCKCAFENGIALNGFSNIRLRENDTRKSINNGVGVFVVIFFITD